jgi:hypothetical protein
MDKVIFIFMGNKTETFHVIEKLALTNQSLSGGGAQTSKLKVSTGSQASSYKGSGSKHDSKQIHR